MFDGGSYTANRRSLLGNKNPPFILRQLSAYDDNITFYSQIHLHPEISVKVLNYRNIVINRSRDISMRSPQSSPLFSKKNEHNSIQINRNEIITLLMPIVETEWFIFVDQTNHIFFFNLTGQVCPVDERVTVINLWSLFYFIYDNSIYLVVADKQLDIIIMRFAVEYPQIKCKYMQILKTNLDKSVPITSCSYFFADPNKNQTNLKVGDKQNKFYLLVTDFKNVYYAKYDLSKTIPISTSYEENETRITFLNMSSYFDLSTNVNGFLVPLYVTTNKNYIVFANSTKLIVIKITDFVEQVEEKKRKINQFLSIPLSDIAKSLNISNEYSIFTTILPPFILTNSHCVFCTMNDQTKPTGNANTTNENNSFNLSSSPSIQNDLNNYENDNESFGNYLGRFNGLTRDNQFDTLIAYSLTTGKLATQFQSLSHVQSIIRGPGPQKFTICTAQGALYADYSNENNPTELKHYKQLLLDSKPNKVINYSDILLRKLKEDKNEEAIDVIKDLIDKNERNKKQKALLTVLANEIMLLQLNSTRRDNKIIRFVC